MRILLALVLLLLPVTALAADKTFGARQFFLDNGLEVIVVTNARVPVVSHMVWIKAGSADEAPGVSGIAHFLEHLMFKGTPTVGPGQYSKIVQTLAGDDNAFTSYDYTAFYVTVAKDNLPRIMALEADRFINLAPPEKDVLSERDVIQEERRQRTDNQPTSRYFETLSNALYPNHPYGRPIIGWASEMAKLTWADAKAFTGKWYAPNNAVLILSGDITEAEARTLAQKYYGAWAKKDIPARVRPQVQNLPGDMVLKATDPALGDNSLAIGIRVPSYHQDKELGLTLDVLTEILSGSPASRLYQSLVTRQKLATSVSMSYDGDALDSAVIWLSATPADGVSFETLRNALRAELDLLVKDGVTNDEVKAAKTRLQESAVFARDSVQAPALVIGKSLATGLTLADVENWPQDIAKISKKQIETAAKDWLSDEAWKRQSPAIAELTGRVEPPVKAEDMKAFTK
jgi:zinc protease